MSRSNPNKSYHSLQFWIIFFFQLFFLTVPLVFTWINEELFEFNKIVLVYAYTLIIVTLWLARMICQKKLLWRKTPFDVPILLFLISQLLSTVFSINLHTSIFGYYTRFNGGLLSTISYILLFYAFINTVEKKHLSSIFFSTFLSALLVSLMAIPEHFGHSFSCLLINLGRGEALSSSIYTVSCWIQDVQTRVFASFGQPNWLAAYAITLIPLGVLLSSGKLTGEKNFQIGTWQRYFYACTTLALFLTLLFTKSRSGFIGLVISFLFGLGLLGIHFIASRRSQALQKINFKKSVLLVEIVGVILAVSFFGTPFTPTLPALLSSQKSPATASAAPAQAVNRLDEGGTDSGDIRRIVWSGAIDVWKRYPVFGSGVETFAYSYYRDRPISHNLVSEWDFLYNKAHNEFLNFLATTGFVGLATYLFFLGSAILLPLLPESVLRSFYAKKHHFKGNDSLFVGGAISVGIVALTISNFFGFSTVMVSALLFLLPACWLIFSGFSEELTPETENTQTVSANQVVVLCLLFFVSFVLFIRIYNMWESDRIFALGKQMSQANQINIGLPLLEQAVLMAPDEPYFYEELAIVNALIAAALSTNNSSTVAAQFTKRSIDLSNQMIAMNSVNLNFYKSQARVYSQLVDVDAQYIGKAKESLLAATKLAPTDPKLVYNIALIELSDGNRNQGLQNLQKSISMKSNYIQPRLSLAAEYEKDGKEAEAITQYEYILENIQASDPRSIERLTFLRTPPLERIRLLPKNEKQASSSAKTTLPQK